MSMEAQMQAVQQQVAMLTQQVQRLTGENNTLNQQLQQQQQQQQAAAAASSTGGPMVQVQQQMLDTLREMTESVKELKKKERSPLVDCKGLGKPTVFVNDMEKVPKVVSEPGKLRGWHLWRRVSPGVRMGRRVGPRNHQGGR